MPSVLHTLIEERLSNQRRFDTIGYLARSFRRLGVPTINANIAFKVMALKESIKEFKSYLGDNDSFIDLNHKHLGEKILLHWGYEDVHLFIDHLFIDDKIKNRFSIEVIRELDVLSEIHERLFPRIYPIIL